MMAGSGIVRGDLFLFIEFLWQWVPCFAVFLCRWCWYRGNTLEHNQRCIWCWSWVWNWRWVWFWLWSRLPFGQTTQAVTTAKACDHWDLTKKKEGFYFCLCISFFIALQIHSFENHGLNFFLNRVFSLVSVHPDFFLHLLHSLINLPTYIGSVRGEARGFTGQVWNLDNHHSS